MDDQSHTCMQCETAYTNHVKSLGSWNLSLHSGRCYTMPSSGAVFKILFRTLLMDFLCLLSAEGMWADLTQIGAGLMPVDVCE